MERTKQNWNGWGWIAHRDEAFAHEPIWSWLASECAMPALLATPPRAFEDIHLPKPALSAADLRMMAAAIGPEHVRTTDYERLFHSHGRSLSDVLRLRAGEVAAPPDAVLYPGDAAQAMLVLKLCESLRIGAIPFGGGTNLSGAFTARRGAFNALIAIDMSRLNRVSEIDTAALTATVGAGISGAGLESALAERGLMFGHAPYSFEFSTLGGWIAEACTGLGAERNGRLRDWLIDARMATPKGWLSGADFAYGTRGRLGLIVDARLRLRPLPERRETCGFLFPDFASGAAAVRAILRCDVPPVSLRLSDAEETRLFHAYAALTHQPDRLEQIKQRLLGGAEHEAGACLLIAHCEGSEQAATASLRLCDSIAHKFGARKRDARKQEDAPGETWRKLRFLLPYYRDRLLDRALGVGLVWASAPWRRIDALHQAVTTALDAAMRQDAPHEGAHGLTLSHIAHAATEGAALCFFYIYPRRLNEEVAQAEAIEAAAHAAVMAEGGSLGRNFAGVGGTAWAAVKQALDPGGILHPGDA